MGDNAADILPDLSEGLSLSALADRGIMAGRVGGERVLIWRDGNAVHAYGGACPHLGAPLDEGLVDGCQIRCPWHHARFDLTNGHCVSAPAFDPLERYVTQIVGGKVFVTPASDPSLLEAECPRCGSSAGDMVIVGGGAAGFAAANELRRCGCEGNVTVLSDEAVQPYDRTLLTKDYLDGNFGDDRLAIARHSLRDLNIALELGTPVDTIDRAARTVRLGTGRSVRYDKLLLATGAEPILPPIPGLDSPHVHVLRSLGDCRRLIHDAERAAHIIVLGGSFIALEAAASLRDRGAEVTVVAPETHPMAKVLGLALSELITDAHRTKGVVLVTGHKATHISRTRVVLAHGGSIEADLVLVGAGVAPRLGLAEAAGLALDKGVKVDRYLRTSDPDIYAAGDIARWPDPHSGRSIRVEHWLVAERQGQTAAANMLGAQQPFETVPFFWTKHFDLAIRYVGHAEDWDEVVVEGDVAKRDAAVHYMCGGRELAVATVGRDRQSLEVERAMEAHGCAGGDTGCA